MWNNAYRDIKIEINDCEPEDLGGGVIVFRGAIKTNWDAVRSLSEELIQLEWSEMYKNAIDPETGKEVYENKSGYLFSKDIINNMPKRAASVHMYEDSIINTIFSDIEKVKDYFLLKYLEIFPLAYKCIWWKVKGHLLKYEPGVYLGSHSDISADYTYGYPEPADQLALRNVVTSLVYLSTQDDNMLSESCFSGGEHYFNYLDIEYKPQEGDIMFFPSNYMAAHEVKKVRNGNRYTYLGWYSQGTPNANVREHVADPIKESQIAKNATNVYMPTLALDFKNYLEKRGYDKSSDKYRIILGNH